MFSIKSVDAYTPPGVYLGRSPLGITTTAEYPEIALELAPGDQFAFLSDGVVEAQPAAGELFGIDRTCFIRTQSAEAIAQAAQAHP